MPSSINMGASRPGFPGIRPPAVPLVVCDPYFSIWSPADRLTDAETCHWTGAAHPLHSLIRIDASAYRLMGAGPESIPALPQTGLEVLPTRTIYTFGNGAVEVSLTFMTPALPDDLELIARPVTYLTWTIHAIDGKEHDVSLLFDSAADLVVNHADQEVTWERVRMGPLDVLKLGSSEQPILAKHGDDLRIDWGYLYVAALPDEPAGGRADARAHDPPGAAHRCFTAGRQTLIHAFCDGGPWPADYVPSTPVAAGEAPALAVYVDLGRVGATLVSRTVLLAYDDLYSIDYFHERLRPYWRRSGDDDAALLKRSADDYPSLLQRCLAFDDQLMADLRTAGGDRYAQICALAYRQTLAGNKLAADAGGGPLLFPKENFSNGCIATVDVIYPMAPQLLFTCPALMKAALRPILDYASSSRWPFPFAPHDLGIYPKANGQVYGGGERTEENQMPVEESGNMLLLMAALARAEGHAGFSERYWPLLTRWAEYLKGKGLDPENQLCTDDFAGHLAHNVNLSVKAIAALRAYALLCRMRGLTAEATTYQDLTEGYARTWMERADDGDHYRLAFDRPGSWSQKYNLVWDQVLDLELFPEEVRRKEMAFYRKVRQPFGVPLDNRQDYTKLDWMTWTATLGAPDDFEALVSAVWDFLQETPDRVPMTDWYRTREPRKVGFQARPVVGGVFMKALDDPALWHTWARHGADVPDDGWAALPGPADGR